MTQMVSITLPENDLILIAEVLVTYAMEYDVSSESSALAINVLDILKRNNIANAAELCRDSL